ncbi:hypothetical protein [Pseudomonas sp. Q11]|uniref:hypothetical protein n=1 Tax=Pseudomonas sp. Q11 TaxID=2968470 RepID=UPI00210DC272|nr:hypothetical protein [Pseudomonas sp. Q11]MCQ6254973.1 hypothetical protein [Pseudomonas sp. Q11]
MAAVLVGQFHARDAEGRVYSVHEFQESTPSPDGNGKEPVTTYRLAIGDRVKKLEDEDEFELVQSGVVLKREPETQIAS